MARGAELETAEPQPPGEAEELDEIEFVDAATRVANPSTFDSWYYGIEDKLGQGTVGMGICLVVFIIALVLAMMFHPI